MKSIIFWCSLNIDYFIPFTEPKSIWFYILILKFKGKIKSLATCEKCVRTQNVSRWRNLEKGLKSVLPRTSKFNHKDHCLFCHFGKPYLCIWFRLFIVLPWLAHTCIQPHTHTHTHTHRHIHTQTKLGVDRIQTFVFSPTDQFSEIPLISLSFGQLK